MSMSKINLFARLLENHESYFNNGFSLIASENSLSPLARLVYISDAYSRYFFNENEVFGRWSFQGGSLIGPVQTDILLPLLLKYGQASHVNLHPVSGLSGMILAQMAFGGTPGSVMLSIPTAMGGHPDTAYVAKRLGMTPESLPFCDWATVDLSALEKRLAKEDVSLIYLDHATSLYPLDIKGIASVVKDAGSQVHLHADTSHVNALVWAEIYPNPLNCGAHSYGGSTHKTIPGPHKAVIFVNDDDLEHRLTMTAVNTISHHHTASILALAITLMEFDECNGGDYAQQMVVNARHMAACLVEHGVQVLYQKGRQFTDNHQVWISIPEGANPHALADDLFQAGIVVNPHSPAPAIGEGGWCLRIGLNEPTRLGMRTDGVAHLAESLAQIILKTAPADRVRSNVVALRKTYRHSYCYSPAEGAAVLKALTGGKGLELFDVLWKQHFDQ
ncbi:MAG: hypothetical protein KQH53_08645 [Desulfarculaceae bacterium]|nr:hypothetical protein [Desulfarculaceae bacterium]